MIDIPYNAPELHYSGRWTDHGGSIGSAWQGSQLRFKVSGSSSLVITADVLDQTQEDLAFAVLNIDGGPPEYVYFSSANDVFSGVKRISHDLPSDGSHTVVLKLVNMPISQWSGASHLRLMSISLSDGGKVSRWGDQADRKLGLIGDSWMGVEADWPQIMGSDDYSIYPTSFGGAKASDLASMYGYWSPGKKAENDPPLDAILISPGVNDYYAEVSESAFADSLSLIAQEAAAMHPEAFMIFLQPPRNNRHSVDYQRYGSAMKQVAEKIGASYIESPSALWSQLTWADEYHLDESGRKTYAYFVRSRLDELFQSKGN